SKAWRIPTPSRGSPPPRPQRRADQREKRKRAQDLPSEIRHLINPAPGVHARDPDHDAHEEDCLDEKPDELEKMERPHLARFFERRSETRGQDPRAKKENDGDRRPEEERVETAELEQYVAPAVKIRRNPSVNVRDRQPRIHRRDAHQDQAADEEDDE